MRTAVYLVRSTDPDPLDGDTLWWSNEGGFGYLTDALVFTPKERAALAMPVSGEWVRFEEVPDVT